MRLRFSLRTLLILTTFAAVACFCWVTWPTYVASRFAAAFNNGEADAYAQLEEAYSGQELIPARNAYEELARKNFLRGRLGGGELRVTLLPRSQHDLLHAQRRLVLRADRLRTPLEWIYLTDPMPTEYEFIVAQGRLIRDHKK
jgi:hypothetical protein